MLDLAVENLQVSLSSKYEIKRLYDYDGFKFNF